MRSEGASPSTVQPSVSSVDTISVFENVAPDSFWTRAGSNAITDVPAALFRL